MTTTNESVDTQTAAQPTNSAKRASVTLTAGEARVTLLARRRGERGETVVVTTDAKKKSTRGMTTRYDTFELAVAALAKLTQEAQKAGWKKAERAGGFKAKPDAFTSMPAAPRK